MKNHVVEIKETYIHLIDVEAKNKLDAINKAKYIYNNNDSGKYYFGADATTLDNVKFRVLE